jgi:hypothetical protein
LIAQTDAPPPPPTVCNPFVIDDNPAGCMYPEHARRHRFAPRVVPALREAPSFMFQRRSVAFMQTALDRTFAFPLHPPELPTMSAAEPNRVGMHNTKGDFVDLYIPRKWYCPCRSAASLRALSLLLPPPFLSRCTAPTICEKSYALSSSTTTYPARFLNNSIHFAALPLVV